MARVISEQSIAKTITVKERTTKVTFETPANLPEGEYEAVVQREIATYENGELIKQSIDPIQATPTDGGFVPTVSVSVATLLSSNATITLDNGLQIPASCIPEFISKACDLAAEKAAEVRRIAAGGA